MESVLLSVATVCAIIIIPIVTLGLVIGTFCVLMGCMIELFYGE